jgi:LmbE family N-acetylglucosaminyl deacetylase
MEHRTRTSNEHLDAVLFSPHLDDAALSAAVRLMRPVTQVVTVFAGAPSDDVVLADYDRFTRATSSRERVLTRLAEDDLAMAELGCRVERLDDLDDQYRSDALDEDRLAARLAPLVASAKEIWVPAAIGNHVDHLATRKAVLSAVRDGGVDCPVFLYADIPYSVQFGWPSWVTGRPDPEYVDVSFWLELQMINCGLDPEHLEAEIFRLDSETRDRKQCAVLAYKTQLPALRISPDDPAIWESFLQFEVAWRIRLE